MKGCDFQHISICLHLLMISLHLLVFPFIYLYFPSFTVFSFIYCLFLHLLSVPSFTDCSFIYIIINVGLTFAPVVCLAISLLISDTRVYSKILWYFAGDLLFKTRPFHAGSIVPPPGCKECQVWVHNGWDQAGGRGVGEGCYKSLQKVREKMLYLR